MSESETCTACNKFETDEKGKEMHDSLTKIPEIDFANRVIMCCVGQTFA